MPLGPLTFHRPPLLGGACRLSLGRDLPFRPAVSIFLCALRIPGTGFPLVVWPEGLYKFIRALNSGLFHLVHSICSTGKARRYSLALRMAMVSAACFRHSASISENFEKMAFSWANGKYTFIMPNSKVSVDVTFVSKGQWTNPFVDVPEGAWYYDGMKFVYENGLMAGTSSNTFSPDVTTTRGMLVTILWRLAGSPNIEDEIWGYPFKDVDANAYYATAVYWARMNGIVAGYSDELFGPNDTITREQMATILYRYAQHKGYDTTAKADLSKYTDAAQIGPWATEAIRWANAEGLVNGTSATTLTPKGSATRAQVAVILTRFCEKVAK